VRCAKFIVRKQWFIAGTDDMHLRVYNYNTMEKVKEWEAHTDYIRFVEVHPNRPYVLSSSDDMSIKLWDWDKDWECVQVFESHVHYVMMIKINPRDTNTFASASLDRSIKVWGLTAGSPHFSLEGAGAHERGVNCIDYYPGGDKPYLLSGADDRTVKIWDYQTKACLQTLEGHSHNVSSVCFHPRLPLIVTASEDGTVRLWHSTTYRPETTLNYGLERAWCIAPTKDANKIAIGYDEGTIVLKLGNERPVASMDTNTGKVVWALGHDIQTMSLKGITKDQEINDGEKLQLNPRDLGSCEVYPQLLTHNCNGQFIVVLGDGEYIIYTSQALRNKAFGSALDFVWSSQGTGDYAIRESISRVKIFKNFKEHKVVSLPISSAEGLFGGACLGVRSSDSIVFFDWDEGEFIRKIDVTPTQVFWNENSDALILACSDSYFVLQFNREAVTNALAAGKIDPEEGVDGSFELEATMNDKVRTGQWVGDCFLFTNGSGKLNYYVGGEVMTLSHLDHPMYLLGYFPKEDRVFLIDKAYNVVSNKLLLSVLNYQTAVVRKDFDTANQILPGIPTSEHASVARFLESQGFKQEALAVTNDPDHKFELAIDLRNMDIAHAVLQECKDDVDSTEYQSKWKRLGDLALHYGDIALAQSCAEKADDLSGLLLLYSSSGNKDGMLKLAVKARDAGRSNVAFSAYFITGQVESCIDLLIDTGRLPEAAFFARTYLPSRMSSVLELWREDLKQVNEKAAEALADPEKYANLFPDLDWALKVEAMFMTQRSSFVPASSYPSAKNELELNLIDLIKGKLSVPDVEVVTSALKSTSIQEEPAPVVSEVEVQPEPVIAEPEATKTDPTVDSSPKVSVPVSEEEEYTPPITNPADLEGEAMGSDDGSLDLEALGDDLLDDDDA
jgi:coatomer subunit beta'